MCHFEHAISPDGSSSSHLLGLDTHVLQISNKECIEGKYITSTASM